MTPAGAVRDVQGQIEVLTSRVRSARVIARALVESARTRENRTAPIMTPKLQALSGKLREVTRAIEERAEKLSTRLDAADEKSLDADTRAHVELDKIEQAVRNVEDLVNQMSNGGPPLEGSAS